MTDDTPDAGIKTALRYVDEFGYAAVSANTPDMPRLKKELGDRAMRFGFNGGWTLSTVTGRRSSCTRTATLPPFWI